MSTWPLNPTSRPPSARSSVDFPEPEAPIIERISPVAISRLISVRIWRVDPLVPKARPTFRHATAGLDTECRSEEHTSELQSRFDLVCRLLLEKKKAS